MRRHEPVEPATWFVAVYGTLMRGYENYRRWLAPRDPCHVGVVEVPYRLFGCDAYPMLVRSPERHAIHVEIFEVDGETLQTLDALEESYGYRRESVPVARVDAAVQVYVYRGAGAPPGFARLDSGRWQPPAGRQQAAPPHGRTAGSAPMDPHTAVRCHGSRE